MPKQVRAWWVNLVGIAGLIAVGALMVDLILSQRRGVETAQGPEPTSTPLSGFPVPAEIPSPLPPSTLTPPPPPTPEPTATFTPGPPTSTPEPLPTLLPELETLVYATTGENYPELYRVQIDETRRLTGATYQISMADLSGDRKYLNGLFPSSDDQLVAIDWNFGGGGNFVSILDVITGQVMRVLSKKTEVDPRVAFLAWSPDSQDILVRGLTDNPDLGDRLWIIDIVTHDYAQVDTGETTADTLLNAASFSPDGKMIAYSRQSCYQCGSEIWRISVDGAEHQRLLEMSDVRVEDLQWSPDGRFIAFVQWREVEGKDFRAGEESRYTAFGELWVYEIGSEESRLLGKVISGLYQYFRLAWKSDSQAIVFVSSDQTEPMEQLSEITSNLYQADVETRQVTRLTDFEDRLVLRPIWSPDETRIAFLVGSETAPQLFALHLLDLHDADKPQLLDPESLPILDTLLSGPDFLWLSAPMSGGE